MVSMYEPIGFQHALNEAVIRCLVLVSRLFCFVHCVCFSILSFFIRPVIVFSIVVVFIWTLLSEINIFDLICFDISLSAAFNHNIQDSFSSDSRIEVRLHSVFLCRKKLELRQMPCLVVLRLFQLEVIVQDLIKKNY